MKMRCMISALAAFLVVFVSGAALAGDGNVQYLDTRQETLNDVEIASKALSNESIVITAFGGSDAVLRSIYQAAIEYEKTTDKDLVFLQAPDRDAEPNSTEFQIFIQGRHTNTLLAVGERIDDQARAFNDLKANIEDGLRRVQGQ